MAQLIVAKGASSTLDPTYACMSHNSECGKYALLHMKNGNVVNREVTSSRAYAEDAMRTFKGSVYVDERTDRNLLPLTAPDDAKFMNLKTFRRSKSGNEASELNALFKATHARLHGTTTPCERGFRGCGESDASVGYDRSAYVVTTANGFTQYRGGFQTDAGLSSDLTRVIPRTLDWEKRLERVSRGLDAVEEHIAPGVSSDELNRIFSEHLDDSDVLYGSCIHDSGYDANEGINAVVEQYDYVTIGAAVGDGNETAIVYRNGMYIDGDNDGYRCAMDSLNALTGNVLRK